MSQPFSLHDISVRIWWGQMHRTFMLSMLELGPPWNGISFLALTPPFITENVTPFFFIRKKNEVYFLSQASESCCWRNWPCLFTFFSANLKRMKLRIPPHDSNHTLPHHLKLRNKIPTTWTDTVSHTNFSFLKSIFSSVQSQWHQTSMCPMSILLYF